MLASELDVLLVNGWWSQGSGNILCTLAHGQREEVHEVAKRKVRKIRHKGGGFAGAGVGGMMQQLQQIQEEMARTQEALGQEKVEVSVGGGAVQVVMTGHQRLEAVTIDPEILDPDDVEMLQDLIVAAINEAVERSQALAAERMSALTGGLDLAGLL